MSGKVALQQAIGSRHSQKRKPQETPQVLLVKAPAPCREDRLPLPKSGSDVRTDDAICEPRRYEKGCDSQKEAFQKSRAGSQPGEMA